VSQGPASSNRVPVSVITGFLGSGKTTLLNRLVRHEGMADTALIVNEFGEIGIDHALVDTAFENTVVMDSGCICCSIRGDLLDTIEDLFANAALGRIPHFSRILIETTGLADPIPIVHSLQSGEEAFGRCALDLVVTTADAVFGESQLQEHIQVVNQVAVADVVLITKVDLADQAGVRRLKRHIESLNPGVPIYLVAHGEIDPEVLFAAGRRAGAAPLPSQADERHDHTDGQSHAHGEAGHAHGAIATHTVMADEPLSWERLRVFLETLFSLRGAAFLRVKGIVALDGEARPVVVQAVGNSFSRPTYLADWPDAERRSRLVFIYRGLDGAALEAAFRRMVLEPDRA
jgi:G3E family GTPase